MRIVALFFVLLVLVACESSTEIVGPQPSDTDACPYLEIEGWYADTTNEGQANGHSFVWETKNWEVIPAGGMTDARVRGEIDTHVVTSSGMTVPVTVSVLTGVVNPYFVVCDFEDRLDRSEIAALDGSPIQSVSGAVRGHFVEGRDPAVIYGEYDIRIVLADGSTAAHSDSWQAPIM